MFGPRELQIPQLLIAAGFELSAVDVVLHNSFELGVALSRYIVGVIEMFRRTAPDMVSAHEVRAIRQGLERDLGSPARAMFGTYAGVITTAVAPGS
jgi:hypothetical protein